jgi:drug/metabolite transporter (DMT)-like permease
LIPKKILPSPYLLLGLTILFWSGNFVLGRGLHEKVPPMALSFWRWFTAWLIVLPFVLRPAIKQFPLIIRYWKSLALFGVLGVAGFSTLVYIGLVTTTATNGVLLNTASPVFIILLNRFFLKEPLSWRQGCGVAVAFLGVIIIVTGGDIANLFGLHTHSGDIFVMAGVFCWALYTVLLHRRPPELLPMSFVGATLSMGTITILPFFLWELSRGEAVIVTPAVTAGILYLALFPSILAYIFWNHAVAQVGANRAGFFIYLMPAFGVLLSLIFLQESLLMHHLIGIVLICAGVYLTTAIRTKTG